MIREHLKVAAQQSLSTLLDVTSHKFDPQGVSAVALLAESHISIHTWPENGYAAVDVFTCGDHTMPESACEHLRQELGADRQSMRSFLRETPSAVAEAERTPSVQAG